METDEELEQVNNKLHQEVERGSHNIPGFLNCILDDEDLHMDVGLYCRRPLTSFDKEPDDFYWVLI